MKRFYVINRQHSELAEHIRQPNAQTHTRTPDIWTATSMEWNAKMQLNVCDWTIECIGKLNATHVTVRVSLERKNEKLDPVKQSR